MKFLSEFSEFRTVFDFSGKFVTFFGSARFNEENIYCKAAKDLAFKLAKNGVCIVTGGGDGIMRAANEGAFTSGSKKSLAFNIKLPFEQNTNPFVNASYLFSNFLPRKFALIDTSVAFVVFPGGFGTLDELFEVLTLSQTKFKKCEIFLYGIDFWGGLDKFIKTTLLENKTIGEESLNIYKISDDIDYICNEILNI